MAIINQKSETKVKSQTESNVLSKEELEFLLKLIAISQFEGRDVQIVYDTAVKLQQQLLKK